MKYYIFRHLIQYLFLLLLLGLILFFLPLVPNPFFQGLLSAGAVFAYVLWGFWHHYREKTLTSEIVIEYFLVALIILTILVALASSAFAAEATPAALVIDLPPVYILPDSPFYFLKTLWEGWQLIWARTPEAKVSLHLQLAQKRLAEAQKIAMLGKPLIGQKLMVEYQRHLQIAEERISEVQKEVGVIGGLLEKLQGVTEPLSISATPSARPSIRRGILDFFRWPGKQMISPVGDER